MGFDISRIIPNSHYVQNEYICELNGRAVKFLDKSGARFGPKKGKILILWYHKGVKFWYNS